MYTQSPEPCSMAFKNTLSTGVGAEVREPWEWKKVTHFPYPLSRNTMKWATNTFPATNTFLADTATLYLYPPGWWHIAEVSCTLLQGNVCFMQLEQLGKNC